MEVEVIRAKISVQKISKEPLAYDYQYWLASMLLKRLKAGNEELANFLHSHTSYKYYTFSNLILEDRKRTKDGLQFTKSHFIISAPDEDFIKGFATGLLHDPEFSLGKSLFVVKEIQIMKREEIPTICTMKTISPIYVKTNRKTKDGNLKETDLTPNDGKFHENLHKNLIKKYRKRYGKEPKEDHFEIIKIYNQKERRYKIKNCYRKCTEMTFNIQGSKAILQFAYEAGLGEKNAMGFGCVEVIR